MQISKLSKKHIIKTHNINNKLDKIYTNHTAYDL